MDHPADYQVDYNSMIDFLEEEHMRREVFTTRGKGVQRSNSITDQSFVSDAGGSQFRACRSVKVAEQDSSIVSHSFSKSGSGKGGRGRPKKDSMLGKRSSNQESVEVAVVEESS